MSGTMRGSTHGTGSVTASQSAVSLLSKSLAPLGTKTPPSSLQQVSLSGETPEPLFLGSLKLGVILNFSVWLNSTGSGLDQSMGALPAATISLWLPTISCHLQLPASLRLWVLPIYVTLCVSSKMQGVYAFKKVWEQHMSLEELYYRPFL